MTKTTNQQTQTGDSKNIQISIPGNPQSKIRPRILKSGRSYTPKHAKDAENFIKETATLSLMGQTLPIYSKETGLALEISFFMPIPGSWSKKKQKLALEGQLTHTSRPDVDNLVKLVKDALNEITYKDDSQIAVLMASKQYSDTPRTEVKIFPI